MRTRYFVLVIVLITLIAYLKVTTHDFVSYDDNVNIYENPYFHPISFSNTLHFWKNTYEHLYIPLTYTVWALQGRLSNATTSQEKAPKFNSHVFHTTNLIIHIVNTLIVFAILRLLVRENWPACAGAFLFALHPVQVETVAWATGLKGLLSTFFSLLAVWGFVRYLTVGFENEKHYRRKKYYFISVHLSFLLAVLAKPSAVVIPVVLFITSYILFGRQFKECIKDSIALVVISIPLIIITKLSQPELQMSYITPLLKRPLIIGDTLSFYFWKLVFPLTLGPDYGRTPQAVLQSGWLYATGTLPFVIGGFIIWRYRRSWCSAPMAVFVASVLPVSGIFPFNYQNISTTADRYVYFAVFGLSLALARVLSEQRSKTILWLSMFLVSCLGAKTFIQTAYWHNSVTLFQHALSVNPNSWVAHNSLGLAFQKRHRHKEAFAHYRKSIELNPDYELPYINLGVFAALNKNYPLAVKCYTKAIELNPHGARAHNNLANVYQKTGRYGRAFDHYKKALSLQPKHAATIYNNIGSLRELQGRIEDAVVYYKKALAEDPNLVQARLNLQRLRDR